MSWVTGLMIMMIGAALWVLAIRFRRPGLFILSATLVLALSVPLLGIAVTDGADASADLLAYLPTVQSITVLATVSSAFGYVLVARWHFTPTPAHVGVRSRGIELANAIVLAVTVMVVLIQPGGPVAFVVAAFERVPLEDWRFSLASVCACALNVTALLVAAQRIGASETLPWATFAVLLTLFWVLGGRAQLFVTLASLLLLYLAHGRISARMLGWASVVFAGFATITLQTRLGLQGTDLDLGATLALAAQQVSLLDGYALAVRFVDFFGVQPALYADTMHQLVPRSLDPDKPMQLSRLLRQMAALDNLGGLTAGLHGEFYVAGGLFAVSALGMGFAAGVAKLDNAWARLTALSAETQALVCILLPLLCAFTLRGGFDTSIFRIVIVVALWLAFALLGSVMAAGRPIRLAPGRTLIEVARR